MLTTGNKDATVSLNGLYKGGQAGIAYNLRKNLALSGSVEARFANLNQEEPILYGTKATGYTGYNRLGMYNFAFGIHYKF
jgi:hypothetical protein